MIRTENLSKQFGKQVALSDVNLILEGNGCYALIGPNASGKTTLLKSILGLVIPDTGNIYVNNNLVNRQWKYREAIGYMPQTGRYPDNMTIEGLFAMMTALRKIPFSDCDNDLIQKFEIPSIYRKRLGTLSGGTRQKISACLAFLFHPSILILDEPTAGLDPVSSEILKEKIIREKQKGKIVLITSHVLSDLDELVDEIIFLQEGKISFKKNIDLLKRETGEQKLSRAIAKIMGFRTYA